MSTITPTPTPTPTGPQPRKRNWVRRHPVWSGILAAAVVAGLALGLLAGYGGSGAGPAKAPTVEQVARQIGATNIDTVTPPTMYASGEAGVTWHGQQADLAVFQSNDVRDKWVAVAKEFGPILAEGDRYVVTTG
jgi:hypothetical protein